MKLFVRAILRNAEGKYLLATHRRGGCNFPGGKVEAGETPEAAVIRELYEETGVRILDMRPPLLRTFTFDDELWEGHFFMVTAFEGIPTNREPAILSEVAFREATQGSPEYVQAVLDRIRALSTVHGPWTGI